MGLVPSLELDEAGHGHRHRGEDEPDADPLELGYAGGVSGDFSCEGDKEVLVDYYEDRHEGQGDYGDRRGGDFDGAHLAVHD